MSCLIADSNVMGMEPRKVQERFKPEKGRQMEGERVGAGGKTRIDEKENEEE